MPDAPDSNCDANAERSSCIEDDEVEELVEALDSLSDLSKSAIDEVELSVVAVLSELGGGPGGGPPGGGPPLGMFA